MKKQGKTLSIRLFQILFSLSIFFLFARTYGNETHSLRSNIFLSQPGDYAVLSKGSQKFYLLIRSINENNVWIEFIEFPCISQKDRDLIKEKPWKQAIHSLTSSRRVFVINLSKKHAHSFYFDPKTQNLRPLAKQESPILSTLLQISLEKAPNHLVKKGKNDAPWAPKICVEGCHSKIPVQAWHTTWPHDASPLSGKDILMYFAPHPITVFPVWTSIDTPKGTVVIRTIDVGHHASSPYDYDLPEIKEWK